MTRVFISYSHKDEDFRVELDGHMALLKRERLVDVWSDHCIRPGEELDPAISAALEAADVILLLVSKDFIHSEYCFGVEMQRAMARHVAGDAAVVPILLRPCDWETAPFAKLKALPKDAKPVTKWPSYDEAFVDIVKQLRALLTARRGASPKAGAPTAVAATAIAPAAVPGAPQVLRSGRMPRSSQLSLPREFTDEDRHDFLTGAFDYIRDYFSGSMRELEARNPGITSRLTALSPVAFTAILFRNGKRIGGCYIRIGGGFHAHGIAYSTGEAVTPNSYNEMLTVNSDKHLLYLSAGMSMSGSDKDKLTEEGAAEHLWTMFISPLQH